MYELNRFNGYGLIGSYGLIGLLQMVHDTEPDRGKYSQG